MHTIHSPHSHSTAGTIHVASRSQLQGSGLYGIKYRFPSGLVSTAFLRLTQSRRHPGYLIRNSRAMIFFLTACPPFPPLGGFLFGFPPAVSHGPHHPVLDHGPVPAPCLQRLIIQADCPPVRQLYVVDYLVAHRLHLLVDCMRYWLSLFYIVSVFLPFFSSSSVLYSFYRPPPRPST